MKHQILISTIVLISVIYGEENAPVVDITLGKIEGKLDVSLSGRKFFSFEGVPYARPPVGKQRFKRPEPVKPWKDVCIARTAYKCMQYNQYTPRGQDFVIGDEDCLYLNIYTPKLDRNAHLDVIVYIHGGAFMFNNGAIQQPHYLMDKDVVYVSLNYRLGPLGFLSTEDDTISGNHGMMDQILALQWIQEHIEYFGGNPRSVTTSGMSAGGASVHFHYLSPKSKGLFARGISQSGSMLNPWVLAEAPLEKTRKLAAIIGCPTDLNSERMVKCMRKKPARQIVNAVKDFQPWEYNPFSPFGIVVDSWASDPLLPEHPYQLLKKKKVSDLPWISSHTNSEGLYPAADWYDDEKLDIIDKRWTELIPFIMDYNYTLDKAEFDGVAKKLREVYFKGQTISKSSYMNLIKLLGDRHFLVDLEKASRLQADANTSPVYHYHFSYRGAHGKSELRTESTKDFGAAHGDDTSYVFKTAVDTAGTENDRKMIDIMVEMFTSFAKTGTPKVPIKWAPIPKIGKGHFTYLKIESPTSIKLESQDFIGNRKFWDSLPLKENEKLFTNQNVKTEL